jgi:uncharacterized protein (TIGR02466 family)
MAKAKATRKKDTDTKIMPIFPTWFAINEWERTPSGVPIDEFNEQLKLALYKMRAHTPDGIYRSNLAGTHHTEDKVLTDCGEAGAELGRMFHTVMGTIAGSHTADPTGEYQWRLIAWAMMYRNGGYATPHTHPNCHFSSVYYVDAGPAEEAELTMATGVKIKPGAFECIDTRGINVIAPGLSLQPGFRLDPKPGMMVAFPSWLPHFVHPVSGDHERICVACNGTVLKHTPKGKS